MNIVFCLPGKNYSGHFLQCWTKLMYHCFKNGINTLLSQKYDSNVYFARAKCLGANVLKGINQKPFQGELNYDYIMWIDSDVLFSPEDFDKLIKRDKDVIGGMYPMEDNSEYLAAVEVMNNEYFVNNGTFEFIKREKIAGKTSPIEVDYIGFGFLLIKRGVFESMNYPWFEPIITEISNDIKDFTSEDVSFCIRCKSNRYKIYGDPTVIVGHEKSRILR